MTATTRPFGELRDGTKIEAVELTNSHGISVRILTFGGILSSVVVPDANGRAADITLGFDEIGPYEAGHPFFGALVGRYANRIGGAAFSIDGKKYELAPNDVYGAAGGQPPRNHLHGGNIGYDKRVWSAEMFSAGDAAGVVLTLHSPDGEEGYPGNLDVTVRYSLGENNELSMEYTASTDAPTPINLTNHAYWNIAGAGSGTVNEQQLTLPCPRYLVVDGELIPTGEIAEVAGTPMDFRKEKAIGKDLAAVAGGYDHCFIAPDLSSDEKVIATAVDPESGRAMEVRTTKPAVQFYGGNFLDGSIVGKGGKRYEKHGAFCLETQFFPDSVNHENFTPSILRPGETYHHVTTHRFFTV